MDNFDLNSDSEMNGLVNIGVGDKSYAIEMTDEALLLNRKQVAAICDHSEGKVLINETMAASSMGLVISEAARMIYEYHYGEVPVQAR